MSQSNKIEKFKVEGKRLDYFEKASNGSSDPLFVEAIGMHGIESCVHSAFPFLLITENTKHWFSWRGGRWEQKENLKLP